MSTVNNNVTWTNNKEDPGKDAVSQAPQQIFLLTVSLFAVVMVLNELLFLLVQLCRLRVLSCENYVNTCSFDL